MPSAQVLCVVLFDSTSAALRAEKLSRAAGLDVKLIPVPRHLSSDCGLCLRFRESDREPVTRILAESGLESAGVFPAASP
ncbi:MAG: DUF3343 domain-containing protein [Deltaproteobacteria bacterium]|nr:DUF3343 domain-containing protein [Deltaproteobacteria bacterium]